MCDVKKTLPGLKHYKVTVITTATIYALCSSSGVARRYGLTAVREHFARAEKGAARAVEVEPVGGEL